VRFTVKISCFSEYQFCSAEVPTFILVITGGDGLLDGLCLEALQKVNSAF